jgi:hypothetical protein
MLKLDILHTCCLTSPRRASDRVSLNQRFTASCTTSLSGTLRGPLSLPLSLSVVDMS